MNTPICDFVQQYKNSNAMRFHMPGHKGVPGFLGVEDLDITEIEGADNLWSADGIIAQSEANASALFGAPTFYSTEGSSLAIRGMLFLIKKWALLHGEKPLILATRNAHKTFVNTAAILDIDVEWIMPPQGSTYEACNVAPDMLDTALQQCETRPTAVYVTSPDYLGNVLDIAGLASIAHKHGAIMAVDNAHGAYLKFTEKPNHPIDLGADLCCDSAHKTLPVLTGGAYLHISKEADEFFVNNAKSAMEMFASTSPSYLIMQSLDQNNKYLAECVEEIRKQENYVTELKEKLKTCGYTLTGDETLKITIDSKAYGYTGDEIAEYLLGKNIVTEYHDADFVVFMFSSCTKKEWHNALYEALATLEKRLAQAHDMLKNMIPVRRMKASEAIYTESELVAAEACAGRILAETAVNCPPAVSPYMCGEELDAEAGRFADSYRVVKR